MQAMVEKGASKEKIGLRGPMPPGVLFAVYDSETGVPEYIPPEYTDIPVLLDELVEYVYKMIGVTNKTVINRCVKLANNGFLIPLIVKTRVHSYRLSDFSRTNEKKILKKLT